MSDLPQRERFSALQGVDEQARTFEAALVDNRLHHAWLLTGPKGLGKAAFAFSAARRLLGAAPVRSSAPLGSAPDDPVNRLIMARSHPDLLVLDRDETGEAKRTISVDDARRLPGFFAKAPALSPRRVAIIDAADDLNVNAANAVLKTLEEPPPGGVLLLVCHAPGKLLPTIRSRCRRLIFRAWSREALDAFAVREGLDAAPEGSLSPGDVLNAPTVVGGFDAAGFVAALPQVDAAALQKLTDRFRGGEGGAAFASVTESLARALRARAMAEPGAPGWAAAWLRVSQLPDAVEAVNLDRADALWSAVAELRAVAASARRAA